RAPTCRRFMRSLGGPSLTEDGSQQTRPRSREHHVHADVLMKRTTASRPRLLRRRIRTECRGERAAPLPATLNCRGGARAERRPESAWSDPPLDIEVSTGTGPSEDRHKRPLQSPYHLLA